MEPPSAVQFDQISMRFGSGPEIIAALSLNVEPRDFVGIIGPSGCGKSTLLNIAAGLVKPTAGHVSVMGTHPGEARRKAAYIFQDATLLPWLTVEKNIALPMSLRGWRKADREAAIARALDIVGLDHARHYYPRQLSGGMAMRVSIARSLAISPRLLLLDEPFGALDEMTRNQLNEDLMNIREQEQWSALFVTHSVPEAVFLCNRIVVMAANPGRIHDIIDIPLAYPRKAYLREKHTYHDLVNQVSRSLADAMVGQPNVAIA